ncbi:gamma carbonic anhydrase family protein [Fontimonas sp. SYSU GA230001]|uniref:gamma carbonic anhydrase family protein n=1 Tax=Fontimonas sp. SYSU GA230001 TaxID=3142450 RepID=UPI0032B5F8A0
MIRAYRGRRPRLGAAVWVDPSAQLIGDVELGDDASVWPLVSIRGDVNRIVIGARSNVQDNSVLHVTHDGPYSPGGVPLRIGDDVTVGHNVILHACTVGHRCLIGMGAIVMDRAVIEDEVLLAAGSVVTPGKTLRSGWLYRGAPAQPSRELTAQERDHFLYSAQHYVRLKNHYLEEDGNRESAVEN